MLKKLHEQFIEKANRPMTFGKLPIVPKPADVPVVATERWRKVENSLVKKYQFRRPGDRERFLLGLLDYERKVNHNATIVVQADSVQVKVFTHDVDVVTELDKEYAAFADLLFKDVVYAPDNSHLPSL